MAYNNDFDFDQAGDFYLPVRQPSPMAGQWMWAENPNGKRHGYCLAN